MGGADHRSCDWNDNSGAHFAAAYGRKELLEFLLANGGSKTKMNSDGQTPLDLATEQKGKLHSTFAVTQHCSWRLFADESVANALISDPTPDIAIDCTMNGSHESHLL